VNWACLAHLRQAAAVWLVGVGGLFGYHFFYFLAMKTAPPVEANLINDLWPLLIVLFSALLPGERLRWWHIAGTVLGFCGSLLLVTGGGRVAFRAEYTAGYASALACAVTWGAYMELALACLFVVGGAVLASRDLWGQRGQPT
jgi:drug/metabolite transporter (DMT)-like permease